MCMTLLAPGQGLEGIKGIGVPALPLRYFFAQEVGSHTIRHSRRKETYRREVKGQM